jgi:hypothetical protein
LSELNQLKSDNDSLKKDNKKLKTQVEHLNKITMKTPNNININKNIACNNKINNYNNDIKVNVNVVAFGQENLDFITSDLYNVFCKGFKTIPNFIELVHFNEQKPEYSNVYMPNKKNRNDVLVFNGEKWILSDKNIIIDQLIDKGIYFVQGKMDELTKMLTTSRLNSVKRFLDSHDENDNKEKNKLTKDIELILYNNKDLITNK